MQNIYVYDCYGKEGKLVLYRGKSLYPYIVTYNCSYNRMFLYCGSIDGRVVVDAMNYKKHEIRFLHKKPLRYFIEKRQCK